MVLVPIMVVLLVRLNRQYEREDDELGGALERLDASELHRPRVVLLVEALDPKTMHALAVREDDPRRAESVAVHIEDDPQVTRAARDRMGIAPGSATSRSRCSGATATRGAAWPDSSAACPKTVT